MKPYYEDTNAGITLYCGDCREILPTLGRVDVTITDPPYGFRKAAWDDIFPTEWCETVSRVTEKAIAVMPGINNVLRLSNQFAGFEYRWMLSVQINNGMTRGLMGFGNWIPVVVFAKEGQSLYRCQQDATTISVGGVMPDHPSPKPLDAMRWIVSRFDGSVLDPFCGSGTTLLAAKQLGRKAIGIEISEEYCEIAVKRLQQEVMQFDEPVAKPRQEAFDLLAV